jgi:YidC/Oxa1 family membrane protein insertase
MTSLAVAALAYLDQVLGGSLGGAIVALSLGARFALLPLTLALARRARRNQAIARALQPELEVLKARHSKNPEKLMQEMARLHRKHNYSPVDLPAMLGGFLQLPVFGLLYGAIRRTLAPGRAFLWIRNLSVPNLGLTLIILTVSAATAYLMPTASEHARLMMVLVQVMITSLFVWKLAAGLGLYWAASGLVSLVQAIWLRRPELRHARPA